LPQVSTWACLLRGRSRLMPELEESLLLLLLLLPGHTVIITWVIAPYVRLRARPSTALGQGAARTAYVWLHGYTDGVGDDTCNTNHTDIDVLNVR
jgi:hypothetical protein